MRRSSGTHADDRRVPIEFVGDGHQRQTRSALRRPSSTRKQAEQNLTVLLAEPSFLSALLQLVVTPNQDRSVRLAASVYLKNTVKRRWEEVT